MFELNVPFVQKDQAKKLGAKWNNATKKWFVPTGIDPAPFKQWWPNDLLIAQSNDDAVTTNITDLNYSIHNINKSQNTDPINENINYYITDHLNNNHHENAILFNNNNYVNNDDDHLITAKQQKSLGTSLSNFLSKIKAVIQNNFIDNEWVIAEISEISQHNGNYFLTLVEYDEQGHKQAQVNARIWKDQVSYIIKKFKVATSSELIAGIKVLLCIKIAFHVQYGLFFSIEDIDPSYTLGDMVAKLHKIREILTKEQIIDRNKKIIAPCEFTKIAVISPSNAAGLGDFMHEANLLQKYNLCECHYFTATFQGKTASDEIVTAIKEVIVAHEKQKFDALIIIRGGGSVADLAWLNDLALARAVCECPLYVMVGIGHQRDHTILDEVAAKKFDTPSKVIWHVFQVITRNAEIAADHFYNCVQLAHRFFATTTLTLDNIFVTIKHELLSQLDALIQQIYGLITQIKQNTVSEIKEIEFQLEGFIREILCQEPKEVLRKGYTLTSDLQGKIITSMKIAKTLPKLKVLFHDGEIIVINNEDSLKNDTRN